MLAGGLFVLPAVAADEETKTFVVQKGHLSANVRELAGSHGWSLVWDSEEDRIINRSFSVANPSLEGCLSNVLEGYEDAFTANLNQAERVVHVTAVAADTRTEDASGSGENGLQWSSELVFEPDLKPADPPEPPPFEEQKPTVRMLDLLQFWKDDEPEPDSSAPTPEASLEPLKASPSETPSPETQEPAVAKEPESPVIALDSKADAPPEKEPEKKSEEAPKAPEPDLPVLQILSMKDKAKAESELAKLQALGHDVFLEDFHQDDTLWHRLKMRVPHAEGVEGTVKDLERLGYKTVWVLPRDSAQKQSSSGE